MRSFLLILGAGIGSSILGGVLGWLIGLMSPEFIALLVQPFPVGEPDRLGAALGFVSGMLLGVLAMAFGLLIEAFRAWALRPRTDAKSAVDHDPDGSSQFGVRSL